MKTLSIQPFYATMIAMGYKWIGLRSRKTDYRGWVPICASTAENKFKRTLLMNRHAIAIAGLADIREYSDETDGVDASLYNGETFEGYSWIFNRVIPIVPFPVKGKLHLFEMKRGLDDLEPIDIDYESKQYDVNVATWWKKNGFIENLDIFGEE